MPPKGNGRAKHQAMRYTALRLAGPANDGQPIAALASFYGVFEQDLDM
jgi:hypothetical protein